MGRITEYIAYLNSKDETIDKSFSYLTITDKIAQKRFATRFKVFRKKDSVTSDRIFRYSP